MDPHRRTVVRCTTASAVVLLAVAVVLGFTVGGLRYRGPIKVVPVAAAAVGDVVNTGEHRGANVILISIDTLRADHVGCYGYAPPTSPQIDHFSKDAVVFERAFSQAPSTLPSHATIFTSMLPSHHGALFALQQPLAPEAVTLAEVLAARGYRTAGFHGGGQVSDEFGLGQGFDTYVQVSGRFRDVVDAALPWLDGRDERPFFLFLHTFEVHLSYVPDPEILAVFDGDYKGTLPDEFTTDDVKRINGMVLPRLHIDESDLKHIVATYDAEIRSMDDAMGRLVAALKERGLYDDSLLIFTSDHGEEFGERGMVGWHSHTLYDELLHVPLIVKLPRNTHAGHRVTEVVRLLDVAPTVLGVVGLPPQPLFDGQSIIPMLEGTVAPRVAIGQLDRRYDPPISMLRTADWKLYEDRITKRLYRARLYELGNDPGETRNVLASNYGLARRLAAQLREFESRRTQPATLPAELSPETVRRLKSLGYLD